MPNKELTTVAAETLEDGAIQVEVTLPVRPRRQESAKGGQPDQVSAAGSPSRIPRITRLMALAIKFEAMVETGEVRDYADLARLGYVTRARLTQIMNLLLLAPDIQERLLFSDCETMFSERRMRSTAKQVQWTSQRASLQRLCQPAAPTEKDTPARLIQSLRGASTHRSGPRWKADSKTASRKRR